MVLGAVLPFVRRDRRLLRAVSASRSPLWGVRHELCITVRGGSTQCAQVRACLQAVVDRDLGKGGAARVLGRSRSACWAEAEGPGNDLLHELLVEVGPALVAIGVRDHDRLAGVDVGVHAPHATAGAGDPKFRRLRPSQADQRRVAIAGEDACPKRSLQTSAAFNFWAPRTWLPCTCGCGTPSPPGSTTAPTPTSSPSTADSRPPAGPGPRH